MVSDLKTVLHKRATVLASSTVFAVKAIIGVSLFKELADLLGVKIKELVAGKENKNLDIMKKFINDYENLILKRNILK